jgi:hypothetical protein
MTDFEPGEKIILKTRRYKLKLILQSLFLVFFIVLPPLLFWISEQTVAIKGNSFALFVSIYSLILLIGWMMFFVIWTGYYLDILIITDRRIININQRGFFNREVATLSLDKVQDITITVEGMLPTFLNFGTIQIQTAAEAEEFIMHDIPDPNRIKLTIFELQHRPAETGKNK